MKSRSYPAVQIRPLQVFQFMLAKLPSIPSKNIEREQFLMDVLSEAKKNFSRKYRLKSRGSNFEKVAERVFSLFDL